MTLAERAWVAAMAFCSELAVDDMTDALTEANNETGMGPLAAHYSGWSAVKDVITSAAAVQAAYADMLGEYTPSDGELFLFKKALRWGTPFLVDGQGFNAMVSDGYTDANNNGIPNLANVSLAAETKGIALLAAVTTHVGKLQTLFS